MTVMIWQILMFIQIVLIITSIILLMKSDLDAQNKLLWIFSVIFIPILGNICCIYSIWRRMILKKKKYE